jgi:hypothetical protein
LGFNSQHGRIFLVAAKSVRLYVLNGLSSSGYRVFSSAIKRQGHEATHSPPSSADVENTWSYASTLPYVSMKWRLIKHRDILTLH